MVTPFNIFGVQKKGWESLGKALPPTPGQQTQNPSCSYFQDFRVAAADAWLMEHEAPQPCSSLVASRDTPASTLRVNLLPAPLLFLHAPILSV